MKTRALAPLMLVIAGFVAGMLVERRIVKRATPAPGVSVTKEGSEAATAETNGVPPTSPPITGDSTENDGPDATKPLAEIRTAIQGFSKLGAQQRNEAMEK